MPVIANQHGYCGVEAVIDKDLSASLLAQELQAEYLMILTDADAVYQDWGRRRLELCVMLRLKYCVLLPHLMVPWGQRRRPSLSLSNKPAERHSLARYPMPKQFYAEKKALVLGLKS